MTDIAFSPTGRHGGSSTFGIRLGAMLHPRSGEACFALRGSKHGTRASPHQGLPVAAGGNPRNPPNTTNRKSLQSPGFLFADHRPSFAPYPGVTSVEDTHRLQADGRTFGFDELARTMATSRRRSSTFRPPPPPPDWSAPDSCFPFSMRLAPLY